MEGGNEDFNIMLFPTYSPTPERKARKEIPNSHFFHFTLLDKMGPNIPVKMKQDGIAKIETVKHKRKMIPLETGPPVIHHASNSSPSPAPLLRNYTNSKACSCVSRSVLCGSSAILECNLLPGQLSVHLTESVDLVVNRGLLLDVQENLGNLRTICLGTDTLSNDFGGVDKILKKVLVYGGEGSGTRSLLGDTRPP